MEHRWVGILLLGWAGMACAQTVIVDQWEHCEVARPLVFEAEELLRDLSLQLDVLIVPEQALQDMELRFLDSRGLSVPALRTVFELHGVELVSETIRERQILKAYLRRGGWTLQDQDTTWWTNVVHLEHLEPERALALVCALMHGKGGAALVAGEPTLVMVDRAPGLLLCTRLLAALDRPGPRAAVRVSGRLAHAVRCVRPWLDGWRRAEQLLGIAPPVQLFAQRGAAILVGHEALVRLARLL